MRDVVTLEVGDEIYAFEKYTPSPRDQVEGVWYRGFVQLLLPVLPKKTHNSVLVFLATF
jgi:hypothetical protein